MLKDYIKEKNWIFEEQNKEKLNEISQKYNLPECVSALVLNRCEEDAEPYIENGISSFLNPFLLTGMQEAVEKIKDAVKNMKTIIIYGDYDVDGVTSTYILMHYLKSIGALVSYYIPSRTEEGYGLNERALIELKQKGADLVITVDLGITAKEEARLCKEIGLDLIVTDHHLPAEDKIPVDTIVINPKTSENYPFKSLAGAGVAFKLVCALSDMNKTVFDYYIPFCAVGTIADLVELCGENRFIAKYGLERLKETKNIGLLSLLNEAKIDVCGITSTSVSFGIAPRLNAAGRLSSADTAVELFMCDDKSKADEIAKTLENENIRRKAEEQKIFERADEIITQNKLNKNNVIVVAERGWHHGVIGIVSSKITEKYYKPSIVISVDDDGNGKASGRSISGFDLFDALKNCESILDKFGGHSLAAGLSLKEENIEKFDKMMNEYADKIMTDEILTPKVKIDSKISISDVSLKNAYALKIAEPYGIKNPQGIFCIENLKIKNIRNMADKPHSFVTFSDGADEITVPAFGLKDKIMCFSENDNADICGTLGINTYNNRTSAQFIVRDIRCARKTFFSKDELRALYVILKNNEFKNCDIQKISYAMSKNYGMNCSKFKIYRMFTVLEELEMIKLSLDGDTVSVEKGENFYNKTDLAKSQIFNIYSE